MVSIDSSFERSDRSANSYTGQSDADPSFADTVLDFISTNGWFVTFGLIGLYVLYTKLGSYLPSWRTSTPQQQQNYGAAEADEFVKRQEAMERARRRMQEVQDALAEKQKEKMAQLEEQKRQEKIENWEQFQQGRGLGSKLRNIGAEESSAESSKLSRRPKGSRDDGERLRGSDYNPLTGSSRGSSYRPERRCVNQGG
uniref:Putative selenoprotein ixodes scapularis selenoprotein n=1 Tax=Amblyomma cajennense TaxID=34607 RepID=A0A023FRP2_AMBCJ